MKKITLVEVLKIKEIMEGIQSNLGNMSGIKNMKIYIEKTIALNKNRTSIIIHDKEDYEFKCTLHKAEEENLYLLESRLFKADGQMVNGYFMVLYKDLSIDTNIYDDVWAIADWKEII